MGLILSGHEAAGQRTPEQWPAKQAVRTFHRIAEILSARHGTPITPARVKRICLAAERKLARALLADRRLGQWMGLGTARLRWRS